MLFPKTGGINSWYGTFVALLLVWITISLPAQNEGVNYGSPILETKYNSDNPEKKNYSLKKGELSLTPAQYEQFLKHFEKVRLDEQPRIYNAEVLDGAQWLIERKTDNGFKAFLTNDAGQEIYDLFDFLFQECRIKENSQRHY